VVGSIKNSSSEPDWAFIVAVENANRRQIPGGRGDDLLPREEGDISMATSRTEEERGPVLAASGPEVNGGDEPTAPQRSDKTQEPRRARTLARDLSRGPALLGGALPRRLRRGGYLLLAGGLSIALAGLGIWIAVISRPQTPAVPAAATVNGTVIPVSEVAAALKRFEGTDQFDQLAEQTSRAAARRQFERIYLVQRIKRLVLRAEAEAAGIDVERDVARRMEQAQSGYPSEKEFIKALKANGYSLAEFSSLIEDQLLEEQLREEATAEVRAESKPSDQELREYYESHREEYRQAEVQQIVVSEMPLARDLSQSLRSAGPEQLDAVFAELAKEHSMDRVSGEKGGQLGWVSSRQFIDPVKSAIEKLGTGEVSSPVNTDLAVYIVRVTDRRVQSLESVRDQIAEQLTGIAAAEVWVDWLEGAYKAATIDLDPRYGKFDPNTGQILEATRTSS
jgi:parvulin-like peptidyl-prolyl isomerase